jgi:hypothetical protein
LGLADKEDAFLPVEGGEVLVGDVILSVPLLKRHQIDAFGLGKVLDGPHEAGKIASERRTPELQVRGTQVTVRR